MKHAIAAALLIGVGCAQMAADVLGLRTAKAVAAATGVSPAMKVFTAIDGFETFASRFFLQWSSRAGETVEIELTPQRYRGLAGPYNRRNAYGAAIAYAPVLAAEARTRAMFESVMRYAFCGEADVLGELGVARADVGSGLVVRLEPRGPVDAHWQLEFEMSCDD